MKSFNTLSLVRSLTNLYLFQLRNILCGLDTLVKQGHQSPLEAVEVCAVVGSLWIQQQVHHEKGIFLRPVEKQIGSNK